MSLISLLIALVILCFVWWAAHKILDGFGIKNPLAAIVEVIVVGLALLVILDWFGYGPGLPLR